MQPLPLQGFELLCFRRRIDRSSGPLLLEGHCNRSIGGHANLRAVDARNEAELDVVMMPSVGPIAVALLALDLEEEFLMRCPIVLAGVAATVLTGSHRRS